MQAGYEHEHKTNYAIKCCIVGINQDWQSDF